MTAKRRGDQSPKEIYGHRDAEVRSEAPADPEPTGFRRRSFLKGIAALAGGTSIGVSGARAVSARAAKTSDADEASEPAPPAKRVPNNILAQCPYCGVGCGTLIQTEKGRIVGMKPDPLHPTNRGLQCIKGLTSAEAIYVDRLTKPLVRKDMTDILKGHESKTKGRFDPELFREASWEEAEQIVVDQIVGIVKSMAAIPLGSMAPASFRSRVSGSRMSS